MSDEKDIAQARLKKLNIPLGIYQHYNGGFYLVYSVSLLESNLTPLVNYYSMEKKTRWTRTLEDFTKIMYPNDTDQPRFAFMREPTPTEWNEVTEYLYELCK